MCSKINKKFLNYLKKHFKFDKMTLLLYVHHWGVVFKQVSYSSYKPFTDQ